MVAALALTGLGPALAAAPDALLRCGSDATCLSQMETEALAASAGAVLREAGVLSVRRGEQPPVRFVDQGAQTHRYLGMLDGVQLHVIRVTRPGHLPGWWVLGEAGAPLVVSAMPVPAPGGRHFVVVSGSELALYQRADGRWSRQFLFEAPSGLSWAVQGWRGDAAAVRLEWVWPEAASACPGQAAQGTLQLRDGPFGWDLVPAAPRRC